MKKIYGHKLYSCSICMVIVATILNILARSRTDFSEAYANTFYKLWAAVFSRLFSLVPFSVFETLIVIAVIFVFCWLLKTIRHNSKKRFKEAVPVLVFTASLIYLLFMISCGINYHRQPFSVVEGIETYEYSKEELEEVCEFLTEQVNATATKVVYDANGHLLPQPKVRERAVVAMNSAALKYPSLTGYYPRAKKFLIYQGLSSQALTGVFVSFTMEPHYNDDMPYYNVPHTLCHELSHLRGFMQEDEAGFIAYLACVNSEYEDFVYSGYLSAYVYCMNALYRADPETHMKLRDKLCATALSDLTYNNDYWQKHDGVVAKATDKINDTYLKTNAQKDGVASYGRMTDLVVAKYFDDKSKQ